jgi:hypothetical protein
MTLPTTFRSQGERTIVSYSFSDIITGEGVAKYYLCVGETSTEDEYILSGTALISSIATGLLGNGTYEFKTPDFNSPSTLKGTAFFGGYVDDTASGFVLKATLYKEKGTLSFDGKGDVVYSDTVQKNFSPGGYVIRSTFSPSDEYIHSVNCDIKTDTAPGSVNLKLRFYYTTGGDDYTAVQSTGSTTFVTKTFNNPQLTKKIDYIQVYVEAVGDPGSLDEILVYEELTSGLTTTTIASEVTSPTLSAEGGILMKMPLTQTNISIGERVMLKVVNAGTGNLVVDPTNEHNTEETAKINIPVKIDL